MPAVELIYDGDCPNVEAAREQLRLASQQADQRLKEISNGRSTTD